jgi:phytoene dehydrogenase-like protein
MKGRAVIIGTGVNELVAAHYLARAGHRVIALEEHAGHDDVDSGWIPPRIVRELGLERHGLKLDRPDPWAAAPLPDGTRLELWRDMARSVESIRRVSPHDAAKWPQFCERMSRLARVLEALYGAPPPDPLGRQAGGIVRLASTAFRIRGLGRRGMEDFLRLQPMPVADWLDDWFENDALKGILGAAGVMHVSQGPRSGGTAFRLLHQHVGSPPGVFRPPRSNVRSVLSEIPGIEIRRHIDVARIAVRGERVAGVVLADGEEIDTSLVVSGADPRRTLEGLVDPGWFDPEFLRAVGNIRARGVVARVDLTFDREPGFSTLVVAPSLDYLERAYDDAKYRCVSQQPYIEAHCAGAAAVSRHRVAAHVQYAPYALADGEWDEARAAVLGRSVVETLALHVPALDAALVERSVLTPRDFERAYGYPEGQAHHAELALDQAFWMRPLPGWANYRTPIGGLYLCGAATHPGAGVAGASGANAAREIIRDVKRGRLNHDTR